MIAGGVDPQLSWYATRASGMVAWAIVTASILWGLALSTRLIRRRGVPAWLLDLHKFLGTLALVFVAIHVFAIWVDSYVEFGAKELFVPMASTWRPGAVSWGIVAMYLVVAVEVTSWTMRKLPRRVRHAVHLSSSVMFVTATIHGFQSGADKANLAVQWGALTGGTLVFFLVMFRFLAPRRGARSESPAPAAVGANT